MLDKLVSLLKEYRVSMLSAYLVAIVLWLANIITLDWWGVILLPILVYSFPFYLKEMREFFESDSYFPFGG